MQVLITGASGLLGANAALEAAGEHSVIGIVNRRPLRTQAFEIRSMDLLDPGAPERLIDETQPDWVIHCAALANVDACEQDPELARRLNGVLPGKLAAAAARGGARLLHVSTDAVFDGQRGEYSETDRPHPLSVYARTKLLGEAAVAEADPGAIIARVNLFGWSPTGRRSLAEWFLNNLKNAVPMQGFTDVYFCPLLANQLARLMMEMLAKGLRGLYHVVSSQCISKYDFGVALAHRFDLNAALIEPSSVSQAGLLAARSPRLTLRTEKLTRDLGVQPPDLKAGLDEFHALYERGHPAKLQAMIR